MKLRLQTKIFILIILVVVLSLGFAGYFITDYVGAEMGKRVALRALDLAHAVAEVPEIQENVGKKNGHLVINPLAEKVRKQIHAEFIVVIDMAGVRYSHPVPDRIGQKLVGGDEGDVLLGREYISSAVGTLGPSLRAFVPIYQGTRQVGAVVVGVLSTDVASSIRNLQSKIIKALIYGLLLGFVGAVLLARNVKKAMFNLEPIEIATLVEEKQAILSSIKEGIIAINNRGIITVMNEKARNLLNRREEIIGEAVEEIIPNTRLTEVLKTGQAEYDQYQLLYERRILTNRIPIIINDNVVGAVASFREMTEIEVLAEELTGVKKYVEALRAQSHEFRNKIHTIGGLLQLGQYNEAVDYIMDTNEKQQDTIDVLVGQIKAPLICGLLLGKLAVAQELKIDLYFDEYCSFDKSPDKGKSNELITLLGNLIDNAMDSVKSMEEDRRRIRVLLLEKDESIYLEVEDWGQGIDRQIKERIFEQGFTTKGLENKGIGLTLVKNYVTEKNGSIIWNNKPEGGVIFQISIRKGLVEE